MTKKRRADFKHEGSGENLPGHEPSNKKAKPSSDDTPTALALLEANSAELAGCLEHLRTWKAAERESRPDIDLSLKQRLATLSSKILPAIQLLGDDANSLQGPSNQLAKEMKSRLKTVDSNAGAVRDDVRADTRVDGTNRETRSEAQPGNPVPAFVFLTKFKSDEISSSLPALPEIRDPHLARAAFTHTAMVSSPLDSYERLEWLGDAYVELIASSFIYQTFPGMEPGKSSQTREMVVRNSTLAGYALEYGFDKRANLPAEYAPNGRVGGTKVTDKERTKVLGDMFEAYVAAVILSDQENGLANVASWLKQLWARTLEPYIKAQETGGGQKFSRISRTDTKEAPKMQLARAIQVVGVKLRYEEVENAKPKKDKDVKLRRFTMGVYLDGWGEKNKQLGFGSGLSKKDAGDQAAENVLANKKLVRIYADKKRAFLAAREASKPEDSDDGITKQGSSSDLL